ncbi:MAG: substrate-binding domain-containing protein [Candidatus Limnocylindria bacterium]
MLLALLVATACGAGGAHDRVILLATTTSFQDSGLLDVLREDFEERTGHRLRHTAVGTGAALAIGASGDADVLVVHAPTLEREFMASGHGARRELVMHNDFVIVGPPSDPAEISGLATLEALRRIAGTGAAFISRGDRSGTHLLETLLWRDSGIAPAGDWYVEAGVGMGQTLTIASEKRAYTLTDRGTYLARRTALDLRILVEKDPPLINIYHVITVDPSKSPRVYGEGANAFADYLVSAEAQRLIASFGVDEYGEPLFFADAGKREEDVR